MPCSRQSWIARTWTPTLPRQASALITAAWAATQVDLGASLRLARQAVEVARRTGDDRLIVRSLAALCIACGYAGDLDGWP